MKTEYKYIKFKLFECKPLTDVYHCLNNNTDNKIGEVKWYVGWRRYCFFPKGYHSVIFSGDCLIDIADFLKQINKEHKKLRIRR